MRGAPWAALCGGKGVSAPGAPGSRCRARPALTHLLSPQCACTTASQRRASTTWSSICKCQRRAGDPGPPPCGTALTARRRPRARPLRWRCPARTRQRRGAQRTPRAACRPLLPAAPSPQPAWGAPGRHGCVPVRTCVGASSETGHGRERRHGRACVCGVSVHICACACTWEHGRFAGCACV